MRIPLALLLFLVGVWLLWSGYFVPLIISFGVGSALLVVWLCGRLKISDQEGAPLHLLPRLVLYIPWLLLEIVKANLDVTKRILHPKLPISPTLFEAPSTQKTDLGRVVFANSITLTPGTVSYGVEEGRILVHAIAEEVKQGLLDGGMDRRVTEVERGE
ncbi:MAG: Na+/H+ antiporter subunit E [Planctomycetota bacterium]